MPYAEPTEAGYRYHDADSHVMETPGFLMEFADPAVRARMQPLFISAVRPGEADMIEEQRRRHRDPAFRARDEAEIMLRKNWTATGSFLKEDRPRALDLLEKVGLKGFEDFFPAEISGGMKKRAAVARALALDPTLLLFDELSAGLDPITARELDELVLRLKAQFNMAILIVTHELGSIQMIADQAVMLHAGKVLAAGTLAEVQAMDDPQVQAFFDRRPRQATVQHGLLDTLLIDTEAHETAPPPKTGR